jgi:hypothetical protein
MLSEAKHPGRCHDRAGEIEKIDVSEAERRLLILLKRVTKGENIPRRSAGVTAFGDPGWPQP